MNKWQIEVNKLRKQVEAMQDQIDVLVKEIARIKRNERYAEDAR